MRSSGGRSSLRRRLSIALIGLAVGAAILQGALFWLTERWVERESLHALSDHPPASARAHLDLERRSEGARERRLLLLVPAGTVLVALAAWVLAWRLSRRTLAPLGDLVEQIRALDPERRGARLHPAGDPELRIIADALNAYMGRLDALVERERAFSAAASHELRTPLAVIAGAVELLAEDARVPAVPLARAQRALVQVQADLQALLALSRPPQPVTGPAIALHEQLPLWAEPYLPRGVAPSPQVDWQLERTFLATAPGSAAIVFTNLLRNALRAAGPHGHVRIVLADRVLQVEDDGPGIPDDELPRVCEPRFSGRDGGSGIGLYIAHTLAQREGWTLQLHNRPSKGAVAQVVFGAQVLGRGPRNGL